MKILIADVEQSTRTHLIQLLKHLPQYAVLEPCAQSGQETLDLVEQLKPDLVLLAVSLPGLDGLQIAAQLCEQSDAPAIIFCTAHDEQHQHAFKISATCYLSKPIIDKQLFSALKNVKRLNPSQLVNLSRAPIAASLPRTHLSARTHKGIELTPIEQVIYFLADNKYVTLRHAQGEVLLDESLKSLHQEYADRFMRIHRNALVSHAHIEHLQRTPCGHYQLHLQGVTEPLSVSRRHVASVRKLMDKL